jgi:hypothetical protein
LFLDRTLQEFGVNANPKGLVPFSFVGAAFGGTESSTVTTQQVDLIELNHYIDEEGREVFRQLIFYDWSKSHKRFHVRAWRLIKHPNQVPQRHWSPTYYQCSWRDEGKLRQVTAPSMRETWTQQDPERVNREFLPESQRIPLWEDPNKESQR